MKFPKIIGSVSSSADSPASIAAAIHINIITAATLLVQPAFVAGLVEHGGFGEQGAGYVASAEMFGLAIGAALIAVGVNRPGGRTICARSMMQMSAVSALSAMLLHSPIFWLLRLLVGVGAGLAMSISFAAIGKTRNPDRNFAWLVTFALMFGALAVFSMPRIVSRIGISGFLWLLSGYYATGIAAVKWLFVDSGEPESAYETNSLHNALITKPQRRMAIAAMFFYYIAQGAVWSYLALMGNAHGLDGDTVARSLTTSQLSGLAGVLLAAWLAGRVSREVALSIGVIAAIGALWALLGPQTAITYGTLVSVFNGAWNWTDPYLLGTMAKVDDTGKVMVWSIAWRLLGLAAGPLLAAQILNGRDFSRVNALGIITLALALACLVSPLRALWRAAPIVSRP